MGFEKCKFKAFRVSTYPFNTNPRAFTRVRPGIRPSFLTRQLKIEALLLLKNIENKNSK